MLLPTRSPPLPHPTPHNTPPSGLHFLAVQPDPDSDELAGLWLLQDRAPPNV